MGTYRIDLILSGKNQLASAMNSAAGTVQAGASKIKSHLDSVGDNGASMGSKIKAGASVGASGLSTLGTAGTRSGELIAHGATTGEKGLETLAHRGEITGHSIAQGAEVGVKALDKVSEAGGKAGANVAKGGQVGAAGLNNISRAGSGAINTMDGLNTVMGGIIGGFGMMTIATAAWSGSSTAEFNKNWLATKVGTEAADQYVTSIQKIVSEVPGDDSFMNQLLTGAITKQTNLTTSELTSLGDATADYLTESQRQGKSSIETQMDLKEYIQSGNTSQLERDSILKQQLGTLEGQTTVSGRINALNKALNDEGLKGISTTQATALTWEEVKGKMQAAATSLGDKVLPYVSKALTFVLELDEKTGGLSTQVGLIGAGAIAAAGALGLISSPIKNAITDAKDLVSWITDKIPGVKTTTVKCVKDPSCTDTTGTTTTGGGITGKVSSIINTLGLTGVMAGTGEAVGVTGALGGGLLGVLGGLTQGATGFGLQSIGNGLGKNTPEGQTGLGQLLTGNVANIAGLFGGPLTGAFSSWGGSYAGGTNPYKLNNPFNINFGQTLGQDWSRLTSSVGSVGSSAWSQISNFGGMLGKLLPGTSSATGGGGSSGIMNDIFGKNGVLDFSRFGLKMPDIKWPNVGQILTKITDTIKDHIPKLNWKIPTLGSINNWIQDKITQLGWHIPTIGDVQNFVQDKITQLGWHIPTWNDVSGFVQDKITWLGWQIPSWQDIVNIISGKIGDFHWPWGPASAVSSVGSGSSGGGGKAFGPPRGPLTDTVVGTMAARSGVSPGYVSQSMASNFSGVPGFTPIANALSDHLAYQFYFGDGKSDSEVWSSGTCNCYDGAQLLETEASHGFGLGAGLQNGMWDGTNIAHTWSVIGGQPFDMAAKLLRGQWNPPSGPLSSFDKLMMDIGPGLEYRGYGGHRYDPISAITGGGNCYDMTLGVMGMAAAYGLPSEMIWGTYGGNSHVWARVANQDYDASRMALERTYNPPAWGPGPSSTSNDSKEEIHLHFEGPVYGYDDFKDVVKGMVKQSKEESAKVKKRKDSFRR